MRFLLVAAAIGAIISSAPSLQAAPKKKDSWCDWTFQKKMEVCSKTTGGAGRCAPWVNSETNRRCR